MTTTEILHRLSDLGVATTATPDGFLDLEPADRISSELLEAVKAQKSEILRHLNEARAPHITRLEPEPLETGLTVWDLLRSDWPVLLETIRDAQDSEGSITVYAPDGGGEVQPVHLNHTQALTATLKNLTVRHPDPLEVVVYALKGERTVLRSRQRRTMIPDRVIA